MGREGEVRGTRGGGEWEERREVSGETGGEWEEGGWGGEWDERWR